MDVVPEALAELVHRAATTTPAHPGDLATVRRRWRARRRRRRAVLTSGLVALVALTGGAVPLLHGTPVDGPPAVVAGTSSPAPTPDRVAAQRLVITGTASFVPDGSDRPKVGLAAVPAAEVRPDGSVVSYRVPEGFELGAALPDGRLAGLVRRGVDRPRSPGANTDKVAIDLVLVEPGGRERRWRLQAPGERVGIVGADDRTVYLVRPSGVVVRDLSTGVEKVVLGSSVVGSDLIGPDARVTGGRIAIRSEATRRVCLIDVYDLAGGERRGRVETGPGCQFVLSPDGRSLAAVHRTRVDIREQRLGIWDVATGKQLADVPVGTVTRDPATAGMVYGLAWDDDRTVRAVWAQIPPGADRVYQVPEVMRIVSAATQ
ncbi:hypothetical protein ABZ754_10150 [Micromonospora purpureochromogenes]|uniref:hypothetical protein n=1 Tax=Micromonospora purpureochromogenes TaxID=47872 RepID=UPI0033E9A606